MVLRHLLLVLSRHTVIEAGQVALVQLQSAKLRHRNWVLHRRNALALIVDVLDVALMLTDDPKSALTPANHAAHLASTALLLELIQEFGNQALPLLAGVCGAQLVDVVRPLRHVVSAYVLNLVMDPVSLGHYI